MKKPKNKLTKEEMRKSMRLTRPPRLEGKAKNATSKPVRKKKKQNRKKKGAK